MKIDIKPTIITADDYHIFYPYEDKTFMQLGFAMNYEEIAHIDSYRAIVWVIGSEDELFKFIFTDYEAWNALVYDK